MQRSVGTAPRTARQTRPAAVVALVLVALAALAVLVPTPALAEDLADPEFTLELADSAVRGDAVTYTATASGAVGVPTGTVDFTASGMPVSGCSAVPLREGRAVCEAVAGYSTFVVATYSGDGRYDTASDGAIQTVLARTVTTLVGPAAATPSGQSAVFTATVEVELDGTRAPVVFGTVSFADGDDPIAGCQTVSTENGSARCETSALGDGLHTIRATYGGGAESYAPSSDSVTHRVGRSVPRVTVVVGADAITATVSDPSAAATPTGPVTFTVDGSAVGREELAQGTAVLRYAVPAGASRTVGASYGGDDDFSTATASTVRRDPELTARVTSAVPRGPGGWFTGPVTVAFTCAPRGAALATACPSPVVLAGDGKGQSVSATVSSADGGRTTTTVSGIDIDATAPAVSLGGVSSREPYFVRGPRGRCVASDATSGVTGCVLTRSKPTSTQTYSATATDQAGNTATSTLTVRTAHFVVANAEFRDRAYDIEAGQSYRLLVGARNRPTLIGTTAAGRQRQPSGTFRAVRSNVWALRVVLVDEGSPRGTSTAAARDVVEVRIGKRVLRLPVRLVG